MGFPHLIWIKRWTFSDVAKDMKIYIKCPELFTVFHNLIKKAPRYTNILQENFSCTGWSKISVFHNFILPKKWNCSNFLSKTHTKLKHSTVWLYEWWSWKLIECSNKWWNLYTVFSNLLSSIIVDDFSPSCLDPSPSFSQCKKIWTNLDANSNFLIVQNGFPCFFYIVNFLF